MPGKGWLPFRAEQYFTTHPPGFLWKASFRMAPLVSVVGRDQYRAGEASMQMRALSLIPVANKTGGGLHQQRRPRVRRHPRPRRRRSPLGIRLRPYPYIRWRITDLEHDRPARY
jgi:hypothetical protein